MGEKEVAKKAMKVVREVVSIAEEARLWAATNRCESVKCYGVSFGCTMKNHLVLTFKFTSPSPTPLFCRHASMKTKMSSAPIPKMMKTPMNCKKLTYVYPSSAMTSAKASGTLSKIIKNPATATVKLCAE